MADTHARAPGARPPVRTPQRSEKGKRSLQYLLSLRPDPSGARAFFWDGERLVKQLKSGG